MTEARFQEIKTLAKSLVSTVIAVADVIRQEGPVNSGALYCALMAKNIVDSPGNFDRLMGLVTAGGTIVKEGLVYRPATPAEVEAFDAEIMKEVLDGRV